MNTAEALKKLSTLIQIHTPFIYVVTHEEDRFLADLGGGIGKQLKQQLLVWSCHTGFVDGSGKSIEKTKNPGDALSYIDHFTTPKSVDGTLFVLKDIHYHLTPLLARQMRDMYECLQLRLQPDKESIAGSRNVILLAPSLSYIGNGLQRGLEPSLEKQVEVVYFPLPQKSDITQILREMLEPALAFVKESKKKTESKLDYTPAQFEEYAKALQGLTQTEIASATAESLQSLKQLETGFLLQRKKEIVRRTEILEVVDLVPSMNDIGGLDAIKHFLEIYSDQFDESAVSFGMEPLRGLIMTGIPGGGKSLLAKATGAVWKVPVLRLDIGKVMAGIVGGSIRGTEEVIWYDGNHTAHRNTIAQLVELQPVKCYVDTYNDAGIAERRQVKSFIKHPINKETKLFKLTMIDGRSIITTGDHGVFTHDDSLNLKEVRVDSLHKGQFLAMPGSLSVTSNALPGTWLDGFLAGAWLGDGDYNGKDVRLHLNIKDVEAFSELLTEAEYNFSVYDSSSSENGKVIHIRDNLRLRMESEGLTGDCHTKRVPATVFGYCEKYLRGLLCGYYSTDGSFSGHVVEVSSVSKPLRDDIAHLLHKVGIHGFIAEKESDSGKRTKPGHDYCIRISAETDLRQFEQKIGFIQDYKIQALTSYIPKRCEGYYVPITPDIKAEFHAMRRRMWTKLHYRPYNIDYRADSVGLTLVEQAAKFALSSWDSNPKHLSNEDYAPILHKALAQNVRWIKVASIEEMPQLPGEEYVYDLSIPGAGIEKFVAGSAPLLVHNSEERMRQAIQIAQAASPCCVGSTLITLLDGTKEKIEDLYTKKKLPEKIQGYDPPTKQKVDIKLYGIIKRPIQQRAMIRLTLDNGNILEVTENHRVLTLDGWVEAKDLTENQEVISIE